MVTLIWARVDSECGQAWDKLVSTWQARGTAQSPVLKGPCGPRAHTEVASAEACELSPVA